MIKIKLQLSVNMCVPCPVPTFRPLLAFMVVVLLPYVCIYVCMTCFVYCCGTGSDVTPFFLFSC